MYKTSYGKDLAREMSKELSGDYYHLVANLLIPPAEFDAWSIKEAIYGLGTDDKVLIEIFFTRTNAQLQAINKVYPNVGYGLVGLLMASLNQRILSQRDIINSIERETSGNFEKGLKTIAQSIKCRPMFFAQRLKDSMKGLGTDEKTLTRIIVSRCEIDMQEIKACFLKLQDRHCGIT
ncbi:hypothetical protein KUTeg_002986 [Tegillarca granosa]|uniref:Annexin n=1 Tax=Tegillarca granosa TaxID=220873 RepID=A0ABQ9FQ95_TEGGR|nr:hypothetical protein KUTeg_002986 [Tegillarca granosa]